MAQILIEREHPMGLAQARLTTAQWVQEAQEKLDLSCELISGSDSDEVRFSRSGLSGTLEVTGERFRLQAQLGFLLSAFKDRIEGEIQKNLDALIASNTRA
jgi:putative polyhydroxyalkanoate system protein